MTTYMAELDKHRHLFGRYTDTEIGRMIGCSYTTVRKYRCRHGIADSNGKRPGSVPWRDMLVKHIEAHGPIDADAAARGVDPSAERHQSLCAAVRVLHTQGRIRRIGRGVYAGNARRGTETTSTYARIIAHVEANGPCRVREIVAAIAPDAGTQARINIGSMVPQLAKAGRIARIDHNLYDSVRA